MFGFAAGCAQEPENEALSRLSLGFDSFPVAPLPGPSFMQGAPGPYDDDEFHDAEEGPRPTWSWLALGVSAGSWLVGGAKQVLRALVVRKEPVKRKWQDGQAWPSAAPAPWATAASPLRPAKRPRHSTYEPGTPALSPLGAPFTPVRKEQEEKRAWEIFKTEPQPLQHISSSEDFWRVQLECIYRHRNPYKLDKVPALLAKYRGNEAVLYKKVCLTYDLDPNKFYSSPAAWAEEDEDDGHQVHAGDGAEELRTGNIWAAAFANGPFSVALGASSESLLPNFSRPSLGEALMQAFRRISGGTKQEAEVAEHSASLATKPETRRPFAFSAEQQPEQRPVALALGAAFRSEATAAEARISPFAPQPADSGSSWVPVFPEQPIREGQRPATEKHAAVSEDLATGPAPRLPKLRPAPEGSPAESAVGKREETPTAESSRAGQTSRSSRDEQPRADGVPMVRGRPLAGAKRVLPLPEISSEQADFHWKRRRLEESAARSEAEVGRSATQGRAGPAPPALPPAALAQSERHSGPPPRALPQAAPARPERHSGPPPRALPPVPLVPLKIPGQGPVGRLPAERRVWPPPRPSDADKLG
mmetsp:Transcript_97550/g.173737  ORF Transcript_97550/g.173737 Transcript_97550/m.173737 type:complete len:589 (-) Transcript_97550:59-1825(-)